MDQVGRSISILLVNKINKSKVIWKSGSLEVGPGPQFLVVFVMLLSTEMKCEYQLGERELDDVEEMEVKS